MRTIGFWLSIILNLNSSPLMILIKSVIYLPLIPKLNSGHSIIAGIVVVPAHLSVLPEEITMLSLVVSIWI